MIQLLQLSKDYAETRAVVNLNLTIAQGEIFGLLGPNGAGKTTTISMLTMLTRPSRGTAAINGYNISRDSIGVKREIGIVLQHMNIDVELTVWENMELHGRLHRMLKPERRRRIRELLDYVGLGDREGSMAGQLSGGLKRRLMIARALMHYPHVLILDEPTVGLDTQTRRRIWELIRKMNNDGMTVLLTTHYIEEAEMLCHRVGIIDHGRLIALGTPQELKKGVGEIVVELNGQEGKEYKLLNSLEQDLAELKTLGQDYTVRESNLEDIFIELTRIKVDD